MHFRWNKIFQMLCPSLLFFTNTAISTTVTQGIQNQIASPSTSVPYTYVLQLNSAGGVDDYCCSGYPCNGTNCTPSLSVGDPQYVNVTNTSGNYYNLGYDITLVETSNPSNSYYEGSMNVQFSYGAVPSFSGCSGGTCSMGPLDTISTYAYPIYFTPSAPTIVGVKNNTSYYFSFSSASNDPLSSCCAGSTSSCSNASCSTVLAPGSTQYVNLSTNGYFNLEYIPCTSNAASCPSCSTVGSFGVTFTTNPISLAVVNQDNGTTAVGSPTSNVYPLDFTSTNLPCPAGTTIPTPTSYVSVPYRGFNLAGADFATFSPPCACDAVYFVSQGATTMRLPVLWEYLQGSTPLGSPIDFTQGNALVYANLVNQLTSAGVNVLIDMHNYMRYNAASPGTYITGDDYIIGNNSTQSVNGPTASQYSIAWGSIATQFANNPLVIFDLMNEPNDMLTTLIVSNYNAAIAAIRSAESAASVSPHLILLEGNNYTCLGSWLTAQDSAGNTNADIFIPSNIIDPNNNYALNAHEYFNGGDDSNPSPTTPCGDGSTNCVNAADVLTIENFSGFTSYLQTYGFKAFLSELNGIANSNCAACVDNFLTAVEGAPYTNPDGTSNGYGFIGWTGWAAGSFDPSYILYLAPTYTGTTIDSIPVQMTDGFLLHMTP